MQQQLAADLAYASGLDVRCRGPGVPGSIGAGTTAHLAQQGYHLPLDNEAAAWFGMRRVTGKEVVV